MPNSWNGRNVTFNQTALATIAITGSIVPNKVVSFADKYCKLFIKKKKAIAVHPIIPKPK